MHDPMTVAFEIILRWPLKRKVNITLEQRHKQWSYPLITIWHNDPETDGSDDSCGWFMRSNHGDKEMLKRIRRAIEFNFDSTFKSDTETVYYTGYFSPATGRPNFSTQGIVLNMFSTAAWEFFNYDRKKHKQWMNKNLFDILHFAENPTDSLRDEIEGTFRIGTGTEWNREESLSHYASIIHGWLLRSNRKWYQHPRWHIHHWRIQFHPFQNLKRRFWDKCCVCGKRGFKGGAMSDWHGTKLWHQECDNSYVNKVVNHN